MVRLLKQLSDDPDLVQKYVSAFKKEEKLSKVLSISGNPSVICAFLAIACKATERYSCCLHWRWA